MIQISSVVSDASNSVTLTVHAPNADSISLYRSVGQSPQHILTNRLPVVNGVATFVDASPPQKTLLTYSAVSTATLEQSSSVQAVLPTSWSLTRPVLNGDIRIGDLILNTVDSDGTVWTLSDIEGWWTLPKAEVPTESKSRAEDGSYYSNDGRYQARTMTLTGVFLPGDVTKIESARGRLVKVLNAVRTETVLRVDETPPKQMSVYLSGSTDIDTIRASGLTQFSVELTAQDPVKYALTPTVAAVASGTVAGGRTYSRHGNRVYGQLGDPNEVAVVNIGTYYTAPVIRINGPVKNPRVELATTGEFMAFTTTLAAGQYIEIDVANRSVLFNGAASYRGTMSIDSTWFRIPPGQHNFKFSALSSSNNTARATITFRSAWIG